jgi:hypothetical protein
MTLDTTVRDLMALLGRLPARDPAADQARALLLELEAEREEERRRMLVGQLLALMLGIGAVREAASAIQARLGLPMMERGEAWDDRVDWTAESGRRRGSRARPHRDGEGRPGSEHLESVEPKAAREHPAMIERFPHIDVAAPLPIPVGSVFEVSVYVDTEGLREGEHGDTLLLPALDELRLAVGLTTSPHFAIRDRPHGEIVIRAAEPRSKPAVFELECVQAAGGTPGIAASFTYEWRPAGSVWRELEVEGAIAPATTGEQDEPAPMPAGALAVDPQARPPDLLVRILQSPDRDERHFDLTVSSPHLDEYKQGVSVPWHLPRATRDIVYGFMEAFTTSDPGGRKAALIGAGRDLFDATPPEFQQAFGALVAGDEPLLKTIYVVTSEPFIPWELMVPSDGSKSRPPLGVEFSVGRWVHPQHLSPPQMLPIVDSYVIAPNYRGDKKLEFSAAEAQFVVDSFNGQRISPAFIRTIDAALSARGATLLHLICHGVDAPSGQVLELDPDEKLREVQVGGINGVIQSVAEQRPFVFINACQVGRAAPSLVGTGGFAARFTKLGARCVIAPIWSVKDSVAGKVARRFYERVRSEPTTPFATILRDIRALAYEGDDPEDSYAAYCFYGDPRAAQASSP